MEINSSQLLYDKYFEFVNQNIEITLKDGRFIKGEIVGFFKGDENTDEPYITKWHIVPKTQKMTLGIDTFGFMKGEFIEHKEIAEVKFCADGYVIKC